MTQCIPAGATTTLSSATGVASTATEFYAIYPNRSQLTISGDVISGCYITPDQRPSRGKYYVTAHYMISKADALDNFAFKSVNGFIKFTLAEDLDEKVQTIYIFGNNDEEITGAFSTEWNDGNPIVEVDSGNSGNKTYVRAYNQSNNVYVPLRSGDYYLSILPTEFTEGFTVVLQMTDGTQLSKRTDKKITVNSNQILPMKKLAVDDYDTDNINYYVLWNEGFSFELGGVTVNKVAYPTCDIRSNAITWDVQQATGLTFLTAAIDNINLKNIIATNRCVIGMEKNHRSNATLAGHLSVADGGTNYLMANLNLTCNGNQLVRNDGVTFEKIAVMNCGLLNMTNNPITFDQGHSVPNPNFDSTQPEDKNTNPKTITEYYPANITSFVMEDCDLIYNRNADNFLICNRKNKESRFGTIKIHNNVFHSSMDIPSDKRCRLLYLEAVTANNVVLTNNTFSNFRINGNMNFLLSMKDGELNISRNIFDVALSGTNDSYIYSCPGGDNKPKTVTVDDNYYHLWGNDNNKKFITRSFSAANDVFPALSESPLLQGYWDPANGKFGAYSFTLAGEGTAPAYNEVGAQRADMTPATAALDSPAANYVSVELGSY